MLLGAKCAEHIFGRHVSQLRCRPDMTADMQTVHDKSGNRRRLVQSGLSQLYTTCKLASSPQTPPTVRQHNAMEEARCL